MENYSVWQASEELYELEEELLKRAGKLVEKRDSYELAKMLVVMNKEVYRYEEEARRLRLTGELKLEIYREIMEDYTNIRRKIMNLLYEHKLSDEVTRLFKIMRFSNEAAGLYLAEYLEETRES